tara:strand:+ start:3620 stop:5089 length:1470 start_codon:yes stop_codon:yes gene_type:complete
MTIEQNDIYCSFWIGESEFALDIGHVQEVLNYPTEIIPPILAPSFLGGFVNLRGDVLPIVDLTSTLRIALLKPESSRSLAVVLHQNVRVAFIVDQIGQIIRPKNYKKTLPVKDSSEANSFIKAVLNTDSSESLIQVLDLDRIMIHMNSVQNETPEQRHTQKEIARKSQYTFAKFITFKLNDLRFAFPLEKVSEVVLTKEIQESAFQSQLCRGFLRLRGRVVPILNLNTILNVISDRDQRNSEQRVLVFRHDDYELGVVVDRIESIRSFPSSDLSPLNILGSNKSKFLLGCVSIPGYGDTVILDSNPIFNDKDIIDLVEGHKSVYQSEKNDQIIEVEKKQTYISFNAHHLFGVRLSEVEGILDDLLGATKATKAEPYVEGIIKYRDDLITLICPRKYFGLSPSSRKLSESVAVVFKVKNKKFGLIADSVDSIFSLDLNTSLKLPDFFHDKLIDSLKSDIASIVSLKNKQNSSVSLMILNVPSLAENVRVA